MRETNSFQEASGKIAYVSLRALLILLLCFIGCSFEPGWANGWPGVSKHDAFSGVLVIMLIITHLAVAGLLAPVCGRLQGRARHKWSGWIFFACLMIAALLIGLFVGTKVFPIFRASIAREWP
jgi:hypothetical protein